MPRNPPWTRDELILALELYVRVSPSRISHKHAWPAPENESTLYVTRTGSIWCDRAMLPAHGNTVSGAGGRYPSELWGRTAL